MRDTRQSSVDWDADIYATGHQINRWPFSEVVSSVIRATGGRERRDISVLEIGCGAGNNVWFLASEGFQAHGLDGAPTAIDYARNRILSQGLQADLRVGDLTALPWDDNLFDIVVDRAALTHNSHDQISVALEETRRVLKPGGTVMSFTLFGMNHPERSGGNEVSYHTFDHFESGCFRSVGLTAFFTFEDVKTLFARFSRVHINKTTVHDETDRLISEEFAVNATR